VFRAQTDSLGRYALKLPPAVYIAYAQLTGFATEYFFEQANLLAATKIAIVKDTTGISFTLAKLPPVILGTIKGAVLDTTKGVGVRSRMVATRDRWMAVDAYSAARSYTVDTDSNGVYTFDNLLPGSYFVLALPMGNYAPAYYTSDTVSTRWRKATHVVINGNTAERINIYVRQLPLPLRGYTGINGTVRANIGEASSTAGAFVFAVRNFVVAGYGIVNGSGQYEIAGLAPGSYTVIADLVGYDAADSKTTTVSYNSTTGVPVNGVADLNLLAVTTGIGESGEIQPMSFELGQNYPNPFNPTTGIRFQVPGTSNVRLVVYNLLGQEVAELVNGVLSAGSHSVSFDAGMLASGVYLYQLSAGTMTATKKMVLLK
jgi:hypothetical protein